MSIHTHCIVFVETLHRHPSEYPTNKKFRINFCFFLSFFFLFKLFSISLIFFLEPHQTDKSALNKSPNLSIFKSLVTLCKPNKYRKRKEKQRTFSWANLSLSSKSYKSQGNVMGSPQLSHFFCWFFVLSGRERERGDTLEEEDLSWEKRHHYFPFCHR